ncbi:hypothetical protein CC80DRAFT_502437 [Byssothecium circinans]|uniref:EamA domain-containing protein n=1 Tax=Byssothecium circinans TaxID=147558 RepID=A0A6A5U525_9PLEO|nr:hypothetical protein CC80DRAFT_502437 [Byssothecium circinans]
MLQFKLQSQYGLGLMLLLTTVVLRVGSNFLMSTVFSQPEFSKPFLVTMINSAFFGFVFGGESLMRVTLRRCYPALLRHEQRPSHSEQRRMSQDDEETNKDVQNADVQSGNSVAPDSRNRTIPDDERSPLLPTAQTRCAREDHDTKKKVIPLSQTTKIGAQVSSLWFLVRSSPPLIAHAPKPPVQLSSRSLSSKYDSAWVLVLSAASKSPSEKITPLKVLSVALAIIGVCIVSTHPIVPTQQAIPRPENNNNNDQEPETSRSGPNARDPLLGDISAVLASVMHAVYTVFLSGKLRGKRVTFPAALFACIGASNLAVFGPAWAVLGLLGWEESSWLMSNLSVQINAAVSAFIDILWVSGMVKTSPLVATIGVKLTIPLALVVQVVWLKMHPDSWYWAGTACVCAAFGLMVWTKS